MEQCGGKDAGFIIGAHRNHIVKHGLFSVRPGGSYAYRASKAAVTNLACNLAADLNAVGSYHPGWVRTEMGGDGADISAEDTVIRLMRRIGKLSLESRGTFEGHYGEPMQY